MPGEDVSESSTGTEKDVPLSSAMLCVTGHTGNHELAPRARALKAAREKEPIRNGETICLLIRKAPWCEKGCVSVHTQQVPDSMAVEDTARVRPWWLLTRVRRGRVKIGTVFLRCVQHPE